MDDFITEEYEQAEAQIDEWLFDSNEEELAQFQRLQDLMNSERPRRAPSTRRNIDRQRTAGAEKLFNDYFADEPTYPDRLFRRRFRMRKHLFLRIMEALGNHSPFFTQRTNVARELGLSPYQKCTAAIRILAYGSAADAIDEYVRIGTSTAILCLENFVSAICEIYTAEYLRKPNEEDLQRLLTLGRDRGFPGMLGSLDCMHWAWKNCPAAWKGQFQRGDHKNPTIILEAVASQDLWIWHAFFGIPGTCNDLNVLDRSPLFDDIEYGRAPEINFTVNGNQYDLGYYLADGIYPPWATIVQSIRLPQTPKDKLYAEHQEAARKDVERAFGVLQARFAIVRCEARSWKVDVLGKIMRACVILHNMIVEDERHTYSRQFNSFENDDPENTDSTFSFGTNISDVPLAAQRIANRARLYNRGTHHRLKQDLVENIWQRFGPNRD